MFDTPEELLDAVRLGEDSSLELKEVVFSGTRVRGPRRDDLADEMAAMANADGGVIVLGIADKSREVVGIEKERLDQVEDFAREAALDSVTPPLFPGIRRSTLPDELGRDQAVIRIDLDRGIDVHKGPGGYFRRVGSAKRPIDAAVVERLQQSRGMSRRVTFDERIVRDAVLDDLDPSLYERFRTELSDGDVETFLTKISVATVDPSGTTRPTVCGVLMASERPADHLDGAFIQAVAYRGDVQQSATELDRYQLDAEDIHGPLDRQVELAVRFVVRNMKIAAGKSLGRSDLPQYDLVAVFEALVNAVAHRDYSKRASKIRLRLYADQLHLFVPGDLTNSMTVESLPLRQATRNEAITSLLARTPVGIHYEGFQSPRSTMMDRRGEGVDQILLRSERLSGRRPIYRMIDDGELQLTISAADTDRR